ncbi:MAG: IS66 family insertion sequence element accessory protein TnpB [bacterium]|nr:IS66 family insertion sequence element accessory protein TnpB [bacterium]
MYLATEPTDLRKGFNGLSALVEGRFEMSAMSGDLFIFLNRRRTQVRILFWQRDGFCILMKRLEAGTFRRVKTADNCSQVEINSADLAMLLEGIDGDNLRRRKRYQHPVDGGGEDIRLAS